jgi:hypothetical protein
MAYVPPAEGFPDECLLAAIFPAEGLPAKRFPDQPRMKNNEEGLK